MEKSLAQGGGINRAGGRSGVLAIPLQGSLAGFGVELAMINHFQPGQQGLVELGQAGDGGALQFGQKIGADKAEKAFDLALAFGGVGAGQDPLDTEGGADGIELFGSVDLAPVDVDGQGDAIAEDGPFETILHAGQLFVPVELGVGHQAGVVIEESKEEDLPLLIRVGRVGQGGAVHGVPLPQVAEGGPLEAAEGFGALLGQELSGGGAPLGQVAAQGPGSQVGFGHRVGVVQGEDPGNGAGRAEGLLPFEGFGPVEGFGRDSSGLPPVRAGLRLEGLKAAGPVAVFPAAQGGDTDLPAVGVGDVIEDCGQIAPHLLSGPGRGFP